MSTQDRQHLAYIALGSNLGEREENLTRAVELLSTADGCTVTARSPFRLYPAQNTRPEAPDYLNGVVAVATDLNPFVLQSTLQRIETQMGRPDTENRRLNQDRVIDLDLLLYNQVLIVTPGLILPHPRMHRRRFVLEPLGQIAPEVLHPALGLTVSQLLERLKTKD